MLRVNQVKLPAGHSENDIKAQTAGMLRIPAGDIRQMRIVRQSIDARKKPDICYIYSLDLEVRDENRILRRFQGKENLVCRSQRQIYRFPELGSSVRRGPVVIVGTGPAGLFCGYFLALHGYRPILITSRNLSE